MASSGNRHITCPNCGTIMLDSGTLASQSCYKCRSSIQANNGKARIDSGRSGNLGWSSRSSSCREQTEDSEQIEDSTDGRTPDMENRRGGLGWRGRNSYSGEQTGLPTDGRTSDAESRIGGLGWRGRNSYSGEQTGPPADGRTSDNESRIGGLGWRGRSSYSGEQTGPPADGRTPDTESRSGGLGWRGRSSYSGEQTGPPAEGRTSDTESRSRGLGWTGRSRSSGEQMGLPANGTASDTESRIGGLGWRARIGAQMDFSSDGSMPGRENRNRGTFPPPGRNLGSHGVESSEVAGGSDGDNDLAVNIRAMNIMTKKFDKSLNLGTDDSETSRSLRKSRETLFSSSQSVVSSEDTFDGDDSSWNGEYPGSPHSADGRTYAPSVSSEEGYMSQGVSRRTRKIRRPVQGSNHVGESSFGSSDANMNATSGELPRGRFLPPGPRGERFVSDTSGSLGYSSDNRSHVGEPSPSSGSGDLSGFNWPGLGNGDPLGHASSSSGELSRPGGLRPNPYGRSRNQPPMGSRNAEGGSRTSLDGLREVNPYGPNAASPSPSPSKAPPAGTGIPPPPSNYRQSPSSSHPIHCCAHCRSETCRIFEHFSVGVCCTNGDCSMCSHSCCQPLGSSVSGQQCHGKPNPFIPNPNYAKERDGQAPKAREKKNRYCRSVFGGANFIMCYECDQILQMPEDFHFSRTRRNKLRCGGCSAVIVFLLVDKTRILPYKLAVNQKIVSSAGGVTGGGGGSRDSAGGLDGGSWASRGDGSSHSRGDQVSCYDNYSGYSDGGGSTEGEAFSQSRKSLRKRHAAALHKLMGYFSARDIMYQAPR